MSTLSLNPKSHQCASATEEISVGVIHLVKEDAAYIVINAYLCHIFMEFQYHVFLCLSVGIRFLLV